jgi:hypothetical protein
MADWAIALLSAAVAAALTILGREIVEWWRRPRLEIDFEEVNGHKPYIHDLLRAAGEEVKPEMNKVMFLRLNVHNAGRNPAMNCEAKMTILKEGKEEPETPIIHWTRKDPTIYKEIDQHFTPISVNRNDSEKLDTLILLYSSQGPEQVDKIGTLSHRRYFFERHIPYHIKVTVYASNADPRDFKFTLYWDGTLDGFHKAVQKL